MEGLPTIPLVHFEPLILWKDKDKEDTGDVGDAPHKIEVINLSHIFIYHIYQYHHYQLVSYIIKNIHYKGLAKNVHYKGLAIVIFINEISFVILTSFVITINIFTLTPLSQPFAYHSSCVITMVINVFRLFLL
jgi:hypothetical protein